MKGMQNILSGLFQSEYYLDKSQKSSIDQYLDMFLKPLQKFTLLERIEALESIYRARKSINNTNIAVLSEILHDSQLNKDQKRVLYREDGANNVDQISNIQKKAVREYIEHRIKELVDFNLDISHLGQQESHVHLSNDSEAQERQNLLQHDSTIDSHPYKAEILALQALRNTEYQKIQDRDAQRRLRENISNERASIAPDIKVNSVKLPGSEPAPQPRVTTSPNNQLNANSSTIDIERKIGLENITLASAPGLIKTGNKAMILSFFESCPNALKSLKNPQAQKTLECLVQFCESTGQDDILRDALALKVFDINSSNQEGQTLLHICCQKQYIHAANLLLDMGAKASVRDNQKKLPVFYIPLYTQDDRLNTLKERIVAKIKDELAMLRSPHQVASEVIPAVPVKPFNQNTPAPSQAPLVPRDSNTQVSSVSILGQIQKLLHAFAKQGGDHLDRYIQKIQQIFAHNPRLYSLQDPDGEKALMSLLKSDVIGHMIFNEFVKQKLVAINEQNQDGNTLLHLSEEAVHRNKEIDSLLASRRTLLKDAGFDENIRNNAGKTSQDLYNELNADKIINHGPPSWDNIDRIIDSKDVSTIAKLFSDYPQYFKSLAHPQAKTALYRICKENMTDVLSHLINSQLFDINSSDNNRTTLLHICCENLFLSSANTLISMGARVDLEDKRGRNPYNCLPRLEATPSIAQEEAEQLGRRLLEAQAPSELRKVQPKINESAPITQFMHAFQNRNIAVMQELFETYPDLKRAKLQNGSTILHEVLKYLDPKFLDSTKFVINSGDFDYNAKDKEGNTPAHIAVSSNNLNAFKLLIQRDDIDLSVQNSKGACPANLVIDGPNTDEFFTCILNYQQHQRSSEERYRKAISKQLADEASSKSNAVQQEPKAQLDSNSPKAKADASSARPEVSSISPESQFMKAFRHNDIPAMEKLFLTNPSLQTIQHPNRATILHKVLKYPEQDHPEAIQFVLKNSNYAYNAKDKEGNTPAHIAVSSNNLNAFKLLIQRDDIDLSAQNSQNLTPMDLVQNGSHAQEFYRCIRSYQQNQRGATRSVMKAPGIVLDDAVPENDPVLIKFRAAQQRSQEANRREQAEKDSAAALINQQKLAAEPEQKQQPSTVEDTRAILQAKLKFGAHRPPVSAVEASGNEDLDRKIAPEEINVATGAIQNKVTQLNLFKSLSANATDSDRTTLSLCVEIMMQTNIADEKIVENMNGIISKLNSLISAGVPDGARPTKIKEYAEALGIVLPVQKIDLKSGTAATLLPKDFVLSEAIDRHDIDSASQRARKLTLNNNAAQATKRDKALTDGILTFFKEIGSIYNESRTELNRLEIELQNHNNKYDAIAKLAGEEQISAARTMLNDQSFNVDTSKVIYAQQHELIADKVHEALTPLTVALQTALANEQAQHTIRLKRWIEVMAPACVKVGIKYNKSPGDKVSNFYTSDTIIDRTNMPNEVLELFTKKFNEVLATNAKKEQEKQNAQKNARESQSQPLHIEAHYIAPSLSEELVNSSNAYKEDRKSPKKEKGKSRKIETNLANNLVLEIAPIVIEIDYLSNKCLPEAQRAKLTQVVDAAIHRVVESAYIDPNSAGNPIMTLIYKNTIKDTKKAITNTANITHYTSHVQTLNEEHAKNRLIENLAKLGVDFQRIEFTPQTHVARLNEQRSKEARVIDNGVRN